MIVTVHSCRLVLKMIANRLPMDSKHVVGGSVVVNGIDSQEKEIIWSVSSVGNTIPFLGYKYKWLTNKPSCRNLCRMWIK